MEDFPSAQSEAKPNDGKDKKKKHGKRANLRLSALASVENERKDKLAAKPVTASLNEAFTASIEKDKKPDTENVAKEKLHLDREEPEHETKSETTKPTVEKFEATEEHENESDKTEDYEELPGYEPEPVEFSGGEVIIHLQGEKPVAERIIPLRAEDEPEAEPLEEPAFKLPVFTPQAEQQHQAQAESPEPAAAGGGEVPPTEPPETPSQSFEQPPEPPHVPIESLQPRPEDIYQQVPSALNIAPVRLGGEQLVTKKEAEDTAYYAARAGQNRGLVTGLLVGGGYEHFKHKRREKRQAKRFKQQGKQLEAARQNYNFGLQEQARTNQQVGDMERQLHTTQKRFENPAQAEKLPREMVEQPKLDPGEQLLTIPADHRLETSAWHSIEIDSKTGKPVENQAFQYGREYYRERAQESAPMQQRNATTGEVALAAAAGVQTPGSSGALPPVQVPSATTQGPPSAPIAQDTKPSQNAAIEPAASAGPLWPWLAALAVVVVCLLLVIR